MKDCTFYRTLFDLFFDNPLVKFFGSLRYWKKYNYQSDDIFDFVNFRNEMTYYRQDELKFLKNMPIDRMVDESCSQNRFIFKTQRRIENSIK